MELKKQFFRKYVAEKSEDWFEDMAERIAFDQGESFEPDMVAPAVEEFLTSRVVTTRGPYVTWQYLMMSALLL